MKTPYDPSFYATYVDESQSSAATAVAQIMPLLHPASVVDVGCGIGTWLAEFHKQGLDDVRGYDGPYVESDQFLLPWSHFTSLNLEKPEPPDDRRFDLAISMEVAEHLSEASAERFVDFLCRCSDVIVFSAAVPHQGGTRHINEQWQSWWAEKFIARGYAASDILRRKLWGDPGCAYYYQQNIVLYARKESPLMQELPKANWITDASLARKLDVIHPEKWEQAHDPGNLGLARITEALPNAISMAAKKHLLRR